MPPPDLTPANLPAPTPVVPIPQDPFLPTRRLQRLVNLFPAGQFVRYLCVGACNTVFGYTTFVICFSLLSSVVSSKHPALIAPLASIVTTPVNITFAYFGYKLFVFKTPGNYLLEWLKAFAVYGSGMIPGLLALSAFTRLLQALFHRHAATLHARLSAVEAYLGPHRAATLHHIATGKAMAGYLAGAIVIGLSTVYSFVGHKKVTFKAKPAA